VGSIGLGQPGWLGASRVPREVAGQGAGLVPDAGCMEGACRRLVAGLPDAREWGALFVQGSGCSGDGCREGEAAPRMRGSAELWGVGEREWRRVVWSPIVERLEGDAAGEGLDEEQELRQVSWLPVGWIVLLTRRGVHK
jgi:hypothetical protein